MPLILDRENVIDIYAEAAEQGWVLPSFNTENLTTCEAILTATKEYGKSIGINDLPIIIGITNNYIQRPQAVYYTKTRNWELGLRLFLSDLRVLTAVDSPFGKLRVMLHLDHIQWDSDQELLTWDMNQFSSIMYDASTLPLEQNIKKVTDFVEQNKKTILIEGACDEIGISLLDSDDGLTTPENAESYYQKTGVDIIVANLGTEHRTSATSLKYHERLAWDITKKIGPRLCLHGTSSVSMEKLTRLFDDGICKVNIWTTLERDSTPTLIKNILNNVSKMVGREKVNDWVNNQLLSKSIDQSSTPSVDYFTTTYRQDIIFSRMKEIISSYLNLWYK